MSVSNAKSLRTAIFLCFIFLSLVNGAEAQIWQEIDESQIEVKSSRLIIPREYKTFSLNVDGMKSILNSAPLERTSYQFDEATFIELPLPDGSFLEIAVEESPIWEEGYGEKFPGMMTYVGYALGEPGTYVRFDLTIHGFHAMIMRAGQSTVFIDPYTHNTSDKEHYIVYDREHFVTTKVFECGVTDITDAPKDFTAPLNRVPYTNCELKEYRLALAATGEYTGFHGGTVAGAAAAQVTSMNRVNGVYIRDFGIKMNIVANNDNIIYTNGATDPYTNGNGGTMLGQNQTTCDAVIGSANYDIGHVFSTGGGGVASLQSPCSSGKARGVTGSGAPVGDPFDIDYVAHEMGHQFGGNHTQNNSCNRSSASVECGSGSSIMGYAGICAPNVQNNSNDHFNGWNQVEMGNFISNPSTGGSCATITAVSNSNPVITGMPSSHVLPVSTPFALTAVAVDTDPGNFLTYCWEQQDPAVAPQPPVPTNTGGPTFRSLSPSTSPTRYLPNLPDLVAGVSPTWEVLPGVSRNMNWKVTVRDNDAVAGCPEYENLSISFSATAGPFVVNYPSAASISWTAFTSETVTWDVANTNLAPVISSIVDIMLSTDGGLTYPTLLADDVTNDGSHTITVPNVNTSTARIMVVAADNIFFDISNNDFTIIPGNADDFTLSVTNAVASVCTPTNATFDLQIGQIGTFTDPVSLSFSSLPGSAAGSFSTNPVNTPGTTTFTVSNIGSVTPGTYPITITGSSTSPTVDKSVDLTLIVSASPSGPVTLLLPADAASSVAIPTDFSWTSLGGAGQSYDIDIALDASFASIVDNATGLSTNSYSSSGLLASTQYFWRVRGSNDCGTVGNSATFSFTTSSCVVFASTDVPQTISSSGTPTVTSTLTIATAGTVQDLDVRNLVGTHTWINDLTITLTSPLGTVVTLFSGICGSEDNFDIEFDDAAVSGALPCPPIGGGEFQPQGSLADFNGEPVTGVWILTISDSFAADGGELQSWSLDICLGAPLTCNPPSALTAGNITDIGADLSWTENGSATLWNIEIGPTPYTPDQNADYSGVSNPFTWSDGASNTEYEYYVQADCGGLDGTSAWSGPYTFSTINTPPPPITGVSCGTGNQASFIFTEEFDAIGGWTGAITSSNQNGFWEIPGAATSVGTGPQSAFSGSNYTNFEASGNSNNSADLISPPISLLNAVDDVELSFYMHAYGAAMGTLDVGVSTSASGPWTSVFTWSGQLQTSATDPWQGVGIDLSSYIGQVIYINFNQTGTGSSFEGDMSLDFVRVEACEAIPTCAPPTDGSASGVTNASASLNWTEMGTATTWDVEYGLTGFSLGSGNTVLGTSSNPLFISSLTSNSAYQFYVRAVCGGINGNSTWSGPYSFNTLVDYCGPDPFVDSGGVSGNYSNSENVSTYVICPNVPGDLVTVTFDLVDIEVSATSNGSQAGCWDYLTIYDGDDVSDPLIAAALCGEESGDGGVPFVSSSLLSVNDSFTSTNPNGCLTFTFFSDGSVVEQGWEATVSCGNVTCSQPFAGTTSNVTTDAADLSWFENGSATEWAIEYGPSGFAQGNGTLVPTTASLPYNLTGLNPDTDYEFYVRAICAIGDSSLWSGPYAFSTLIADPTPCENGFAGIYPCDNFDLMAHLTIPEIGGGAGVEGNDIWGWTDPLDGKEYAIMGLTTGTVFIDITDALNPVYLGSLPTHTSNSIWRDIKVYQNHAFIVSEASGHGMQVFDLTNLRNVTSPPVTFSNTTHYSGFGNCHNIVINEQTGFAYAVGTNTVSGGLHFVNIQNPAAPVSGGPGFSGDGYTHDAQAVIYNGPDVTYQGREIVFASNEDTFTIVDVNDKTDAQQISRTGYPGSSYTHQGWVTEDHEFFLMNDELDEQNNTHNTRTYIWNIQDLDAPIFLGFFQSDIAAIDHNNYVKGDSLYQANYRGGLRLLDISNVANANLSEVGYFDVYPASDAAQFNGAWSNYPYFESGNIIISSIEDGLFIVRSSNIVPQLSISDAVAVEGQTLSFGVSLSNPSSSSVTVTYTTQTGTAGSADYTSLTNTLTFAPGETSKTVEVQSTEDNIFEGDEQFTVDLSAPTGGTISDGTGIGTIIDNDAAPEISISDAVAVEGQTLSFGVSLSNPSSSSVTVTYTTQTGTAGSADYTSLTNTLTFAPGETSKTVEVQSTEDNIFEGDEQFTVDLSAPTGGTISDGTGIGTIIDNDAAPEISISDAVAVEGQTLSFGVSLSNPSSSSVTVTYTTQTGTAGSADYTSLTNTLTFAPGETSKTVEVQSTEDNIFEGDEQFTVDLSAPTGGTISDGTGIGTIIDNDAAPEISISDAVAVEGQTLSFGVSLSNPSSSSVTVTYTTQTGTAGSADYTSLTNTLTFAPGETSKTVEVQSTEDNIFEGDEQFTVDLSAPTGGTISDGTGIGTIIDNDAAPEISISDAVAVEGQTLSFGVSLSNPSSSSVTVTYTTQTGTAGSADYTSLTNTLTFAPGETSKTVEVQSTEDNIFEGDEQFTVDLSAPTGGTISDGTGIGTIIDNDAAPEISISDAVAVEGQTLSFGVSLSNPSSSSVTVTYTTQTGTAGSADYTSLTNTLTFAPGETSKTVEVQSTEDNIFEGDEQFTVDLSAPTGGTISDGTGIGTIIDNDAAPEISISDAVAVEGQTLSFGVSLSNPSSSSVTVTYTTQTGTAGSADYTSLTNTLTFAPGETSKTVEVQSTEDNIFEGDEQFTVDLSAPTGGTISDGTGIGTIIDNDAAPQLSISDAVAVEGQTLSFGVSLSNPSSSSVTVTYTTQTGTAGSADYTSLTNTLTFAPGETSKTVEVQSTEDNIFEGDEQFTVDLSAPTGGTISDGTGIGTIIDNDDLSLVNDDCSGAISLTPSLWGTPAWETHSVSGATESSTGCIGDADDDTWYSFVAESANDVIIVNDIGSASDMVVEVYDGCGGSSLGCFDNYGLGEFERCHVGGLTVGSTYYFRTYDKATGGPASGEIRLLVKTFAIGAIRDIFCGITDYGLEDYFTPERQDFNQLYPFTTIATAGYGVRMTDQGTTTAYEKNKIGGYGTQFFQFSDFLPGIPFNTLFDAQARHALNLNVNGAVTLLWSDYGPACTMGLGGVTQTQIRPEYCTGAVDYSFSDQIQATPVPDATQYRFIFTENGNTFTRTKSSYSLNLNDVPGLEYGKTYQVTVRVQVNGTWSLPGASCSINMLTQPPATSVTQQYCNGTVLYPSSNYILAEIVQGADLYQWRFIPLGGGQATYEYTTSYSLSFGPLTEVNPGVTYDVAVRARVQGLWGDFQDECPLTIQPNPGMEAPTDLTEAKWLETGELTLYPNPSGGEELMLILTGLDEEEGTVQLELLDMMGRLIQSERISVKGEQINYKMLFEERLPSGLYLIRASQEGMIISRRLVIE